jgi:hypothetical protein
VRNAAAFDMQKALSESKKRLKVLECLCRDAFKSSTTQLDEKSARCSLLSRTAVLPAGARVTKFSLSSRRARQRSDYYSSVRLKRKKLRNYFSRLQRGACSFGALMRTSRNPASKRCR